MLKRPSLPNLERPLADRCALKRCDQRHSEIPYSHDELDLCPRAEKRTYSNFCSNKYLLAEAAVDALCHVDVVASGAARAVLAGLGLNGDGLGRADRLAQLARNAPLLACG